VPVAEKTNRLVTDKSMVGQHSKACCLFAVVLGADVDAHLLRSWSEAYSLAEEKLAELTLEERAKLVNGVGVLPNWKWQPGYYVGNTPGIPSKEVPWLKMQDSGNGFRGLHPSEAGTAVVWPCPLALASTWDEELVEQQAIAIGHEFRGKDANVALGPGVNVHRVARGGRNFEYLSGEDPYLGARLVRPYVRGIQSQGVLAVVKHFAFNEQETHRRWESSNVDDQTAWELYYPPFEAAVDAGAASLMCAYNRVNGTPACSNRDLLVRDLREKMGFHGFVMSDWAATHGMTMESGLDMDQPGFDGFYSYWHVSHKEEALNISAQRILASIFRVRLEQEQKSCIPPSCLEAQSRNVSLPEHVTLAREVAKSAVVLLKNNGILPINASKVKKIGVLGMAADAGPAQGGWLSGDAYSGGGSGHVQGVSSTITTVLDALSAKAEALGVEIRSAHTTYSHKNSSTLAELKDEVDMVLVVAKTTGHERSDRPNLHLDDGADTLIADVAKTKPAVVLLMLPGAILMPWRDEVAAIASLFHGGQESGHAFASILFGDSNPVGKLPIMMPKSEADTIQPSSDSDVPYSEKLKTSYRSESFHAAYPFGFGLSYTTFLVQRLDTTIEHQAWLMQLQRTPSPDPPGRPADTTVFPLAHVEILVENIGKHAGAEVVQTYLAFPNVDPNASSNTPALQLRGFRKTQQLLPGQQEILQFNFSPRDFALYLPTEGWRVQDKVILRVGTSSEDLQDEVSLSPLGVEQKLVLPTTTTPQSDKLRTTRSPAQVLRTTESPAHVQNTTESPAHMLNTTESPAHMLSTTESPAHALDESPAHVPRTTEISVHSRDKHGFVPPDVPSPSTPKQGDSPTEANTWILLALQPLLLLAVLGLATLATRSGEAEERQRAQAQADFGDEEMSTLSDVGSSSPLVGDPTLGMGR